MGKQRLKTARKRVGDKITIYCKNYNGLTFECEIIGELPEGRWDQASAINLKFLMDKLDWYHKSSPDNPDRKPHPNVDKVIALVWLRMPNKEAFQHMAEIVNKPNTFNVTVKMETESSAYGSFLDAYKTLLWGMRWLMVPAIMGTMILVIANAISISVRERRTEMAVLKVLGFRPNQVMFMVMGEALLIGFLGGLLSAGGAYVIIQASGGIPFPIAFFSKFFVSLFAALLGFSFGIFTALVGSILPAWSAQSVKAAEVFSKVV
jgi:putative ABC transport system permease protein